MAEDLQHLIDAIQKEGVDKAEAEAEKIRSDARNEAKRIVEEAENQARDIREKAEKEGQALQERGEKALQQAARNILISLGRDLEKLLERVVLDEVQAELKPELMQDVLEHMAKVYFERNLCGGTLDIYMNQEDEKALAKFFTEKMRDKLKEGLQVHLSPDITRGFRVSFREEQFYHDFTPPAIAEELCSFLQPRLQKVVREVADQEKKEA